MTTAERIIQSYPPIRPFIIRTVRPVGLPPATPTPRMPADPPWAHLGR